MNLRDRAVPPGQWSFPKPISLSSDIGYCNGVVQAIFVDSAHTRTLPVIEIVMATDTNALPDIDKVWDFQDPATSERRFLELLVRAEAQGDVEYVASVMTQIARTHSLRGTFKEAHIWLDRADSIVSDTMPSARVRSLLERGRVYNSSEKVDSALPLFREAHVVATRNGLDNLSIDAMHMIAIAEPDPRMQVEWGTKALEIVKPNRKLWGWLWPLYNNLGESFLKLNQFADAYAAFSALAEHQKAHFGGADMYTQKDMARALRGLGKHADALNLLNELDERLQKRQERDGYISAEIGECLFALGQNVNAARYFREAVSILSKDSWYMEHERAQFERMQRLSTDE